MIDWFKLISTWNIKEWLEQKNNCICFIFVFLLIQAKKLVEALPQEIRANVSKEEAEKLKAALEAAGGTVVLE